jgi:hypothetical protein
VAFTEVSQSSLASQIAAHTFEPIQIMIDKSLTYGRLPKISHLNFEFIFIIFK